MTTAEIAKIAVLSHPAGTLAQENPPPSQFLDAAIEKELYQDAVQFLAHKMAPRTAIQWAHDCVKALRPPDQKPPDDASLDAVQKWLQFPTDAGRWEAKAAAEKDGLSSPADCVAMAVFLNDGSVATAGAPETAPPAHSANRMAAGSIMMAVVSHIPEHAAERYRQALTMGRALDAA